MNVVFSCNILRRRPGVLLPLCKTATIRRSYAIRDVVKKNGRRLVNEKIPHSIVQVASVDGTLAPPEPLKDILARVNLKVFFVALVEHDKAIVQILNKKEEKARTKALEITRREHMRANEQKEIQMTWGVAPGDLAHKMDKVRRELEKKFRVNLIFAPKSRQPLPPPHERDEKVAEVLDTLKDVAEEWMPRTFKRSMLTVHLRRIDRS